MQKLILVILAVGVITILNGQEQAQQIQNKTILERLEQLEKENQVLYFITPYGAIGMTLLPGLRYIVEIEGIYNIDYGATLYFDATRDGKKIEEKVDTRHNGHAGLYLYINDEVKHWRAFYAGSDSMKELDAHYQCLLKKGNVVEIKAKRIFSSIILDLKVAAHPEYYAPPYLRLSKVGH